jgi:hypothetical protein
MTPIVHGLKQEYEAQVDFQLFDASQGEGAAFFEFYGLLGHPSYILLDPDGVEQWRGIGPFERDQLAEQILTLLGS